MDFYKRRDFGALVSDTFQFFKFYGKSYFRTYLHLNGPLLAVLLVLILVFYENMFASLTQGNLQGQTYIGDSFFSNNQPLFYGAALLFCVTLVGSILILLTYPVFFMKAQENGENYVINRGYFLNEMKNNFWKLVTYFFGVMFIFFPIILLIGFAAQFTFLLSFLLLVITLPIVSVIANLTLFHFLHTNSTFLHALKYGFRSMFSYSAPNLPSPFLKYWTSTLIISFLVIILSYVFSIIPAVLFTAYETAFGEMGANQQSSTSVTRFGSMLLFIVNGSYYLFMMMSLNILYVNSGFIYYDSRTDLHQMQNLVEIENIGKPNDE